MDLWVAQNVDPEEKVLTSTYKRDLVSLLFTEVKIDNELHSFQCNPKNGSFLRQLLQK